MAKIRSPNYPGISLPDAIERIRKIHSKAHTHKVDAETMAKAVGYGGLNGAALTVLSALKKYELLEEIGKELRVSNTAMIIIADPVESEDRRNAIQFAAFSPVLFSEVRKQFPDSIPGDEIIRSFLLKKSFSASSVDIAIRAFRESMKLVTDEGWGYNDSSNQLDADMMLKELEQQSKFPVGAQMTGRATSSSSVKGNPASALLEEVGVYPVAKNCMVRLLATVPLTETAVKTLIKHLQMGIDVGIYPKSDNEVN
jgi:hypothetical protein